MLFSITIRSLIYALLCVLIWSFIPVISRIGQASLDSFQFLFWSNVFSMIAVILTALFMKKTPTQLFILSKSTYWKVFILGGLDCLFYLLLYYGYTLENGIAVLVIQYSWPLLIIGLSVILLKDRLTLGQIIGVILGFIAVIITFTKGNITSIAVDNPQALLLVFAGAFCFALMSVLSKQFSLDAYMSTVWLFVFSTLISLILMWMFSEFKLPDAPSWLPVILNGVLINGVSYILWFKAMNSGESTKIASVVFLSPVLSMIWLVVIFHDPFVIAYAVGLGLVLIAGILCIRAKSGRKA